jgi:gamma-tubulin complex component 5
MVLTNGAQLPWPIMNIIQRSSVPVYQQVFTFLLQMYRAKYLLQNVTLASIRQAKDSRLVQQSFKLRQRLIWVVDILRSYLTETVILLSTEDMITAMAKAEDIDAMSMIHLKYVARLQEQALLAQNLRPIHKAIISLLDLGALFSEIHIQNATVQQQKTAPKTQALIPKSPGKGLGKPSRRKSFIPAIIEDSSSDFDTSDEDHPPSNKAHLGVHTGLEAGLKTIDEQFVKLLPFVTAALRSVGRVGAEPIWEMLAERLEWDKKKER